MTPLRSILVATDFSENAAIAYPYAATLAKTFDAKILLAHVTEPVVYSVGPGQIAVVEAFGKDGPSVRYPCQRGPHFPLGGAANVIHVG